MSSTFTDTNPERKILLEEILPQLQQVARQYDIEVTFVDLRYGAWEEETNDNRTWQSCYNELIRCKQESLGLYFLSLQGNKYGFQFIPRNITKDLFEARLMTLNPEAKELVQTWYCSELTLL